MFNLIKSIIMLPVYILAFIVGYIASVSTSGFIAGYSHEINVQRNVLGKEFLKRTGQNE